MSYEPTTWKDGDLVTSVKLNKIEQGIAAGGGILIVHQIDNGKNPPTLDKTWQEIHDADVCYIIRRDEEWSDCQLIIGTDIVKGKYVVDVFDFDPVSQIFSADSPNGTLTLTIEEGSNEPVA